MLSSRQILDEFHGVIACSSVPMIHGGTSCQLASAKDSDGVHSVPQQKEDREPHILRSSDLQSCCVD